MEGDRGHDEEEARIEELTVLETERLALRRFRLEDAAFVLELVNDPDWIRHIGDRHVRDLDAARAYIQKSALAMYERLGFGMYVVGDDEEIALYARGVDRDAAGDARAQSSRYVDS